MRLALAMSESVYDFGTVFAILITRADMKRGGINYGANVYGDVYSLKESDPAKGHNTEDPVFFKFTGNAKLNTERVYDCLKEAGEKPILLFSRAKTGTLFRYNGRLDYLSHEELAYGQVQFKFLMRDVKRNVFTDPLQVLKCTMFGICTTRVPKVFPVW